MSRETRSDARSDIDPRPHLRLYEVGPRDGLQNEPESVPAEAKIDLVRRLAGAGLRAIEITSFVSPRWIPQLADADRVAREVPRVPGTIYSALVPNLAGYERFHAAQLPVAAFFVSASETHNRRNVNCSVAEAIERFRPVADRARADGVALRAYVSTVCGCPFEGDVKLAAVIDVVRRLPRWASLSLLGDTIGRTSRASAGVGGRSRRRGRTDRVALHLHDTWGRALANAGRLRGGFAPSTRSGGSWRCPYAPGGAATSHRGRRICSSAPDFDGRRFDAPSMRDLARGRRAAATATGARVAGKAWRTARWPRRSRRKDSDALRDELRGSDAAATRAITAKRRTRASSSVVIAWRG